MKDSFLKTMKPAANKSVHYLLSGALWTFMGLILFGRGIHYVYTENLSYLLLFLGLILGHVKSHLILDKSIKKGLLRIEKLPQKPCLGAVYSYQTWLIVFVMAGSGVLLRHSFLPASYLAVFCSTIGWSLVYSSRHGWQSWLKYRS